MDDGLQTTDYHLIPAHGDVRLTVIYTNQELTLDSKLTIFESLL
jgi:hypothetical protein